MHAAKGSIAPLVGQLVQYNLSPKGAPEGMLVRRADGGVVQVNFDPELAGRVTSAANEGEPVTLDVAPFADAHPDAHPVYELVRLAANGGAPVVADGPPETDVAVRGTVVRLNHARRGEVNGGILDTGDFVHLRPHGAKAVGLKLGQTLEAEGEVRDGWSGHRVIEARSANGVAIGKPPHKAVHEPHRRPKSAVGGH